MDDVPAKAVAWHWSKQFRKGLLRQIELTTAEALALRPLFPDLTRLLPEKVEVLRKSRDANPSNRPEN